MAFFIFAKDSDNIGGTLYRVAENQFDLVEEICRNNPDVCSSNKTRIQLKEIPADDL